MGLGEATTADTAHGDLGQAEVGQPLDAVTRAKSNRRAQQRYRERQRERVDGYKQTIAQLTKELGKVTKDNAKLTSRLARTEKGRRSRQQQAKAQVVLEGQASIEDKVAAMSAGVVSFMGLLGMSEDALATVDVADFFQSGSPQAALCKELYFEEMSRCMKEGGDDVHSPAFKRMVDIVDGMTKVIMDWAQVDAKMWRQMEFSTKKEPCPSDLWQQVLGAMALSPDQKAQLMDMRAGLLNEMECITAQRARILAVLQAVRPDLTRDPSSALSFVHAADASEELAASLEAEHRAHLQFVTRFCSSGVISHVQQARASLAAASWLLDLLAICNALAEEAGEDMSATTDTGGPFAAAMQSSSGASMAGLPMRVASPFLPEDPAHELPDLSVGLDLDDPLLMNDITVDSWLEDSVPLPGSPSIGDLHAATSSTKYGWR